jgi:DnaK suppressor protein
MSYLNENELSEFKTKLLEERKKYEKITHQLNEEAKTPMGTIESLSQHQAEAASDNFSRDLNLHLTDEERNILLQIERALEKMDEGTYGYCDVYPEETIPKVRLEAMCYATKTIKAVQEEEKKAKKFKYSKGFDFE